MPLPLWGIVCSVPYNVICIWAILCMVPIRRPWLFALLWQIVCLPIFFIPAESAYGWLRTVLSSVLWLSLVLLFVKRRSLRVVFAAVLISLLSVVTEVLATMLTILLLGKYVDTALVVNEPRSMLMVQIIFWSIFALLCWVLVYIWRRGIRPQDEPYLRRFILVLLGAMALCCVLADFLLFHGLRNYTNQQLAYYNGVVAHIEETARLRHELRNQLQTVYALMERGEYDHAQELLTAFAVPLAAGEEVR